MADGDELEPSGSPVARAWLGLAIVAPLAGLGAGVVGALFRLALDSGQRLRGSLIAVAHGWSIEGLALLIVMLAGAAAAAAMIVRRFAPAAAGSGIPRVQAVLSGQMEPATPRVIPAKFVAGSLAIGAGLALGREGPSVQMGASIAHHTGRVFRLNRSDCRALLAAGAGAGFATAFNAPIAGALFVLEGLMKRFEAPIALAALGASAVAIWVSRGILGDQPDYRVAHLAAPGLSQMPLFVGLGLLAGFAGLLYCRALLSGLRMVDRFSSGPVELRAAAVGALVGLIAWFAPDLLGGGDLLAQQALSGNGSITVIPLIFLFRLALIVCSVASGAPGGLLAPFLALGAELGLWGGLLAVHFLPNLGIQPQGFAVVGMAALFAAIVRAPLTGIVLVMEMTADATMLMPMIVACFAAVLVPSIAGCPSILDSLQSRLLQRQRR